MSYKYMPKVSVGLVLYKGEKYLNSSIKSLIEQDYENIEFIFRDQSPNSEAYNFIKNNLFNLMYKVKFEKGPNLWHSGGHNALINRMTGDYYIVASNDMLYPSDFVSKMVEVMEKPENRHYSSATCKLLVWDFLNNKKTNKIDSCGIAIEKNHHFYDIGQTEEDNGQYDDLKDIFGPSGALSMFKKTALDDISYKNKNNHIEYYDTLLHYKNDVDLAYRLQWAGHKSLFIPNISVWHDRQAGNKTKSKCKLLSFIKNNKTKSDFVQENSFFGQEVVLIKNFSDDFSILVRIKTFLYRLFSIIFFMIFNRKVLKQFAIIKEFRDEIEDKADAVKFKISAKNIEKIMK